MYWIYVHYRKRGGGEGKRNVKRRKTPGWWVLRNQQWFGVPTLVKREKVSVIWNWNGPLLYGMFFYLVDF